MNANIVVNGIEAITAPNKELRLASSEIATTREAETKILNVYCHIIAYFFNLIVNSTPSALSLGKTNWADTV